MEKALIEKKKTSGEWLFGLSGTKTFLIALAEKLSGVVQKPLGKLYLFTRLHPLMDFVQQEN